MKGLECIDTEVSSPGHDTAWTRISRGVTQQPRQSLEFALEMGGFFYQRWNRSGRRPTRETWICESGGRLRFILNSRRRHQPTYCTQGRPDSARPGIGRLNAFQSQSVLWKDASITRESPIGERRWDIFGFCGCNLYEPTVIFKAFTIFF